MEKKENEGFIICLIVFILFSGLMLSHPFQYREVAAEYESEYEYELANRTVNDCWVDGIIATKYNPVKEQCDSDPLITADGSKINLKKLNSRELHWLAVSRDLLQECGYHYGDTVIVVSDDPQIDGKEFVIRDTMNPRWTKRIDILSPIGDSLGKWENLCMYKKY